MRKATAIKGLFGFCSQLNRITSHQYKGKALFFITFSDKLFNVYRYISFLLRGNVLMIFQLYNRFNFNAHFLRFSRSFFVEVASKMISVSFRLIVLYVLTVPESEISLQRRLLLRNKKILHINMLQLQKLGFLINTTCITCQASVCSDYTVTRDNNRDLIVSHCTAHRLS